MNRNVKGFTMAAALIALTAMVGCKKDTSYGYEDGYKEGGEEGPNVTVDTSVKNVDVSKYAQARVFPGLICSDEPRLNNVTLNMDLNYRFVGENLRISVPPQPQFSTGLYVAPGELLIVDVPQGEYSLSLQVGAWTDNLSALQNAPRDPLIYSRMQLAPGRNYMRNLYGGHVYIFAGRPAEAPVRLTFSNVVKSPDFVLGETTDEEWRTAIRNSCVPYLELRSKNIAFVVPREFCIQRNISQPTALMEEWDTAIEEDYYKWEGLEENPAQPIDQAPLLPWRIVQDIKPSVGYGHSGFPIVTYNDYGWFDEFTNLTTVQKGWAWGTFHELGHNNQQTNYWSWSTLGETTCNLFSFKVAHRQEAVRPEAWPPVHPALNNAFSNALAFAAAGGQNFDGTDTRINDPFARLTPFIQIFDLIPADWGYAGQPDGWAFMEELYKKARRAQRRSNNDQDKRDFVYEALCDFTRTDWRLFFNAWGIQVSTLSQNTILAKGYQLLTQEVWKYNPLTRTGGNTFYDQYNRANWSVTASSEETSGEGAAPQGRAIALIDDNINTFWHSQWTGTGAQPPHVITIDMKVPVDVKGFSFRQRYPGMGRAVKNLEMYYSNDGANWTPLTNLELARVADQQDFLLTETYKFRYFRAIIPNTASVHDGTNFAALSDINVIKP